LPYRGKPAAELPAEAACLALTSGACVMQPCAAAWRAAAVAFAPQPHFSLGLPAHLCPRHLSDPPLSVNLVVPAQVGDAQEEEPLGRRNALAEVLNRALMPGCVRASRSGREDQRTEQHGLVSSRHRSEHWQGLFLRWLQPPRTGSVWVHLEGWPWISAMSLPGSLPPVMGFTVTVGSRWNSSLTLLRLEAR